MFKWVTKLVDSNEKQLARLEPYVKRINALEPEFENLPPEQIRAKMDEFRESIAQGQSLNELLPEVFAAVREAAKRTLGQRHFNVQLMGGTILHQGKIAEMKTGEGKTLVATLPVSLNALNSKGVHVVTVNDYLAKRDTQWMGPIYQFLGLGVACLQHESAYLFDPASPATEPSVKNLRPISRREAYLADITYGTNHEFGFDYLRDNMVLDLSHCVQRELNYAIVDEVDNILIDEARTPLIISGQAEDSAQHYQTFARLIPRLRTGEDYAVEDKTRSVSLTEGGTRKMEESLGVSNLYDPDNYNLTHYMDTALKAQALYKRDRDYVVNDGQVIIVDEFTGRLMHGRRYSEGLHQAIEAKEGVKVQPETLTMATITLQNYFRLYRKLAGMTGTAATEAEEFYKIYKLDVVVIPTNVPLVRTEHPDRIYKTEDGKFRAAVKEIEELHQQGRPVLVGTVSIERSERLSQLLQRRGVPHQVLNAKFHEKEAAIVAQAGQPGAVTIATNMAGRGTDIILGGNPQAQLQERLGQKDHTTEEEEALRRQAQEEWAQKHQRVVDLGGLHILGTERHESRRIDNQLRGRSGRQGDPGSSRFYVSLEDDVLRRFGGEATKRLMDWAGLDEDAPMEHSSISWAIQNAQVKVEGYHFEVRKHLVDYDDVMNKHREVIYEQRRRVLSGADLKANIQAMIDEGLKELIRLHLPTEHADDWNLEGLLAGVGNLFPLPPSLTQDALSRMSRSEVEQALLDEARALYEKEEQELGAANMRSLERLVMLRAIDARWIEHLTLMENVREGIGLAAYGQTDPLVAYKREAFSSFQTLQDAIKEDIVRTIYHVRLAPEAAPVVREVKRANTNAPQSREPVKVGHKVGRNDPCPCGSGKKYKKCHGAADKG